MDVDRDTGGVIDQQAPAASRVKDQATRLFEMRLRGGVEVQVPLSMFDSVNVETERKKGLDEGFDLERHCCKFSIS
jgi:hypothetical protein